MNYQYETIIYKDGDTFHLGRYADPGKSHTPIHWHRSLEIVYLVSGSLEFILNGQTYYLVSDDFIVVHPKTIHSTACIDGNTAMVLHIPIQFLKKAIPDLSTIHFFCHGGAQSEDQENITNLRAVLDAIYDLDESGNGYNLKLNSFLYDVLYQLYTNFCERLSDTKKAGSEKYLQRLEQITEFVEQHYREEITLAIAADELGLNPEYFSRFFKKYMNQSFMKYVNTIRLEHASLDLLNTDYSISRIMEENGFRSYKLFLKLFREHYGCSPKELLNRR